MKNYVEGDADNPETEEEAMVSKNYELIFSVTVSDVASPDDALEFAATALIRTGLDRHYVLCRDKDSDESFILTGGEVYDVDDPDIPGIEL